MRNRSPSLLKSWDYRAKNAFFVTISAWEARPIFGEIRGKIMGLNRFGCVVWDEWRLLEARRPNVILDEFIVLPNCAYLILFLDDEERPTAEEVGHSLPPGSLSAIMGGFKSGVTRAIGQMRGEKTEVWQSRFQNRVLRDARELNLMRQKILGSVANWSGE